MKLQPYEDYLEQTVIPLRLACSTGSGWPSLLSLWYTYRDGSLYCATQSKAKVVAHLQQDARCAFEIASDLPPYCGIRGQATAEIVPQLGEEILMQLLHRYLGGTENGLARMLLKNKQDEVAIRLSPVSIYAWNFEARMRNDFPDAATKPCPDV